MPSEMKSGNQRFNATIVILGLIGVSGHVTQPMGGGSISTWRNFVRSPLTIRYSIYGRLLYFAAREGAPTAGRDSRNIKPLLKIMPRRNNADNEDEQISPILAIICLFMVNLIHLGQVWDLPKYYSKLAIQEYPLHKYTLRKERVI